MDLVRCQAVKVGRKVFNSGEFESIGIPDDQLESDNDNYRVSSDYIQSSQNGILRLGNFVKKTKRNAFG